MRGMPRRLILLIHTLIQYYLLAGPRLTASGVGTTRYNGLLLLDRTRRAQEMAQAWLEAAEAGSVAPLRRAAANSVTMWRARSLPYSRSASLFGVTSAAIAKSRRLISCAVRHSRRYFVMSSLQRNAKPNPIPYTITSFVCRTADAIHPQRRLDPPALPNPRQQFHVQVAPPAHQFLQLLHRQDRYKPQQRTDPYRCPRPSSASSIADLSPLLLRRPVTPLQRTSHTQFPEVLGVIALFI